MRKVLVCKFLHQTPVKPRRSRDFRISPVFASAVPHKIGVITFGTFTTTTRGLVPCRKKSFPKVSREEQPLKIVPEAAVVPKKTFFIRLEPGFESSDAFLIPGVSLTAHCEIMGKWEPEVRPECDYSNLVR